jgi:predicted ATP-grasp superfamily ATP-dependent carboligase
MSESSPVDPHSQPDAAFGVWDVRNGADHAAWLAHWQSWPTGEIHAHPAYVGALTEGPKSRAYCAWYRSPRGAVLYPFFLRDLSVEPYWTPELGPLTDLITPYGYGGAFYWPVDPSCGEAREVTERKAVADEFWPLFDRWAATRNVVSAFVRFSLFPEDLLPYPGERVEGQPNIVRPIDFDDTALWQSITPKARRDIEVAQESGVSAQIDETGERLADFRRLYEATMDRLGADAMYYFPPRFYETLGRSLAGQFAFFHAIHQDRVVASALVLMSARTAYYFLNGSEEDTLQLRPNHLLQHVIMRWARDRGRTRYVMGGGRTADDGLFRFKRAFAPHGVTPFFVGRRILDHAAYQRLIERRLTESQRPALSWGFFPAYRAPAEDPSRTNEFNVLLSSAGHRIERLKMFTWTLKKLRLSGRTMVTDMTSNSAAFQAAEEAWTVPPCDSPDYIPTMIELCREHHVRLLVPNIDPDLGVLAAHREDFAKFGVTVLVSSPQTVAIGEDKGLTHHWLNEQGFPTVRQTTPDQVLADPQEWPFPLVVKPRNGSASRGVVKVFDRDELLVMTRRGDFLVQTVAPGREYTVDVLVNCHGKCVCAVPRLRTEVRGGEMSKGVTVRHRGLIDLATRISEALPGAYGPLNIQIFLDDATGKMCVIEINPRFAGGFPLSYAAGADFPSWIIEEILERPSTAAFDAWTDQLVMLRFFSAVFFEIDEQDAQLR